MSRVIKSSSLKEVENQLVREMSVSDVVFDNDFETTSGLALNEGNIEEKLSLVDEMQTQIDDLRAADCAKQLERALESSQKLLDSASEVLADARVAYKKTIKKGEKEAQKLVSRQKGKLVQLERNLRARIKKGYNRGLCSGYEEGFLLGQKSGQEDMKASLMSAVDELEKIIRYINLHQDEIFKKYEEQVVDLAFNMAQKITATVFETEKEVYLNIVKSVLSGFRELKWVEILVPSAKIAKKIMADKQVLLDVVHSCESIKVHVSNELANNELIIDTQAERVETDPEIQLSKIRENLRKF